MEIGGYVYIMCNKNDSVLYTGVTSNLVLRVYQHKNGWNKGFTSRYKITKLVYYEFFPSIVEAILREKQIKGGSRAKKIALVNNSNPEWRDLYPDIVES